MLTIDYNNQIFKMYWTYGFTTEEKSYKRGNSTVNISTKVRYTGIVLQSDEVAHTAYVRCNPDDNFSRETGRLLTLDKITDTLHPNFAALIYKTYHSRK
jgi:hypothetical protein